ncbi:MAG: Fic/DOC family protein [Candidatus Methanoperedens nitroreducens]|uniref:Fic/DOC family protein n=1 Tax=Candidatus Methanoperedens nitratireducens TaxID=1392998 RepID=A0A0N8KQN8_9EURY|nr:Fic family protein [Candidatus Methanoperedens sp. BLZ2]KAB2945648.1 MAG: Fic family protein [Candidatus Methanoperedens sp.]KPQ42658.1 MAG: Fic/DOC family protein [Candidatus Methanoperedens sp. BLZ1]MBZ0177274.1 Fic family protein [Candidatus Methanoperedens nitroreducens]CAG0965252.1 Protein adenylyltransferase and cysteine protease IbpA [Methanosarcinales archaeon]MCX9076846.1 Fic family protein [Candidatus Methanoperedens sp.]
MPTPGKYDLLIYLHFNGPITFNDLENILRGNILFEDLNTQILYRHLRELIDSDFVLKIPLSAARGYEYSLNLENDSLINHISFLLWCRKEGLDYNKILTPSTEALILNILKSDNISHENLLQTSNISTKTLRKHVRNLIDSRFIHIIRQKPMVFEFLVNDVTLWYLTMKGLPVPNMECKCKDSISNMDANRDISGSREIMDKLIKLHIYSSTVTEGNTASNEDVERIINDLPTNLTPKEIIEIKNTKDALDLIIEVYKDTDLNIDLIKNTHQILMRGLIKEAGMFFASPTKRIVGSKLKLPSTNKMIEYLMKSLVSFYDLNKNHIHPLILGSIFHFLFVSIHPFKDGNGRAARLIHSFILLKSGFPIFAFNPERKYEYFNYLEKGRESDISDFVRFIIDEHRKILPGKQ